MTEESHGSKQDSALEENTAGRQTKEETLTVSKEASQSRREEGGPALPKPGR